MSAEPNGAWADRATLLQLKDDVRDQGAELAEVKSHIPAIGQLQGELIRTRAALSHLQSDVAMGSQSTEFLRGRVGECTLAIETLTKSVHRLERTFTEFIAEWRSAQP